MPLKVKLPEDIGKIIKIIEYLQGDVTLCGSIADYFLLKQTKIEVKDIDFIINNLKGLKVDQNIFRPLNSRFYKNALYTRKINGLAVEIFQDLDFNILKDSFILPNNLRCESPQHRYNFLQNLEKNISLHPKPLEYIQTKLLQYQSVYDIS